MIASTITTPAIKLQLKKKDCNLQLLAKLIILYNTKMIVDESNEQLNNAITVPSFPFIISANGRTEQYTPFFPNYSNKKNVASYFERNDTEKSGVEIEKKNGD